MHLHEIALFDLEIGVKVTQDVAKYPLHHVTYSDTKFEVSTSDGLGGDAFTKKIHIFTVDLDVWVKVTRNIYQ